MPQNIEIKARANDFQLQGLLAEKMSDTPPETLVQLDTFFKVEHGRLKLREFPDGPAQLIFYQRSDVPGPKLSDYQITESLDPEGLKKILSNAYTTIATVAKTRRLLISGRTRIHIDEVKGLGNFIELEVVLSEGESIAGGQSEAKKLMDRLQIREQDLIAQAYVDLILKNSESELDDAVIRQLVYR
ncbi:MAG: adenylate cyclase class IV [Arenicella sp.]|jgi:adenylate cyclase class IV